MKAIVFSNGALYFWIEYINQKQNRSMICHDLRGGSFRVFVNDTLYVLPLRQK